MNRQHKKGYQIYCFCINYNCLLEKEKTKTQMADVNVTILRNANITRKCHIFGNNLFLYRGQYLECTHFYI